MRFIRQKEQNDCGVASGAMMLECPYSFLYSKLQVSVKDGMRSYELRDLIRSISRHDYSIKEHNMNLAYFKIDKTPKILLIYKPSTQSYHFLFQKGNHFYDPTEKRPMALHKVRALPAWTEWFVVEEIRQECCRSIREAEHFESWPHDTTHIEPEDSLSLSSFDYCQYGQHPTWTLPDCIHSNYTTLHNTVTLAACR